MSAKELELWIEEKKNASPCKYILAEIENGKFNFTTQNRIDFTFRFDFCPTKLNREGLVLDDKPYLLLLQLLSNNIINPIEPFVSMRILCVLWIRFKRRKKGEREYT
jgi:hypothetical protein